MAENYHMIEYIRENPGALRRTLDGNEEAIQTLVKRVRERGIRRIVLTGVGSSYTADLMAAPVFRYHCPLETHVLTSIEVGHYADRLVDEHTLVVSVSRSGERGWVVDGLKDAVERGAFGVAVTGTPDSLMAQVGEMTLITGEGPEITFPKTKSVVCCAGLLMRLGLALADPGDSQAARRLEALHGAPELIGRCLEAVEGDIEALAPSLRDREPIIIGGTGGNHGVALEAGIKIQETTYTITHGDHTSELLHGSLGPFEKKWMMILAVTAFDLEPSRQLFDLVGKFGALRLCVIEPGLGMNGLAEHVLTLPEPVDPLLAALFFLPPLQLVTYYLAIQKGMNPDAPPGMRDVLDAILPPGREEPELRE